MGDREMSYDRYLEGLSARVRGLTDRARSGWFWLAGSGLLAGRVAPPAWRDVLADAGRRGFDFAVSGLVAADSVAVRERSLELVLPDGGTPG